MTAITCDVCVIGAGPAGSTTARRLSMLGRSVVLVRKHGGYDAGESVSAAVLPLADVLGIREEIENAAFLRSKGSLMLWDNGFVEFRRAHGYANFNVQRAHFDRILQAAAREAGAFILEPGRISAFDQAPGDGLWRVQVKTERRSVEIRAKALADASGRACVTGGHKRLTSAALLALCGRWRGLPFSAAYDSVEAGVEEWFWGAALASGDFAVTVFIDPSRYRRGVIEAGSKERFYRQLLTRSRLIGRRRTGELAGPVCVRDATSYAHADPISGTCIRVGDAAFTIDPLSSQGVLTAMGSGLHAAAVLNTLFGRPSDGRLAVEFYRNRLTHSVAMHARAATALYTEAANRLPSIFWQRRADPGVHTLSSALPIARRTQAEDVVALENDVYFGPVSVSDGAYIQGIRGVFTPAFASGIAFVNGIEIAALLQQAEYPVTVKALGEQWTRSLPTEIANSVLDWAIENQVFSLKVGRVH